jgi:hypothetical protein
LAGYLYPAEPFNRGGYHRLRVGLYCVVYLVEGGLNTVDRRRRVTGARDINAVLVGVPLLRIVVLKAAWERSHLFRSRSQRKPMLRDGDLWHCSGNHYREPPCALSQAL